MGRIRNEIKKKRQEAGWIVGRDFNARTGEKGALERGWRRGEGKEIKELGSKQIGRGADKMEKGWSIMNGDKEGDRKGEVIFPGGRGEIVIDYVIIDRRA